ncbi:hypothetical protein J3R82DRAFT_4640 [Butyriboletus roseoflavus]|nr:hypothetical protein J3R82DRAFT_4640 [Butyriboletus roseoflavus]
MAPRWASLSSGFDAAYYDVSPGMVRVSSASREYWAKLNGNGDIVWGPDPQLTPLGEQQAQEANAAWEKELQFEIPLPEKLYTSPLTRAIRTNQVTFDDAVLPSGPRTTIVEVSLRAALASHHAHLQSYTQNMREHNGVHTCDKRRTRSEIHTAFPEYCFEEGFTERDELWTPDYRERHDDIDRRARHTLDMIFNNDTEQCKRCLFFSTGPPRRWKA